MVRVVIAALLLAITAPATATAQTTVKFGYQPTAPIATFIAAVGTGAFGKEGLKQVIRAQARQSAEDICKAVVARLEEFAGGEPQHDDVTLVVVKFPK